MAKKTTAPAPVAGTQPPADPQPERRGRGRPRESGTGPVRPVNITLDEQTRAIAERIAPGSTSRAIREALRYWAQHHPAEQP